MPNAKTMSPGTRAQTKPSIIALCTNSGERANQTPCVMLAQAWAMPAGTSDMKTIIARPMFTDQKVQASSLSDHAARGKRRAG